MSTAAPTRRRILRVAVAALLTSVGGTVASELVALEDALAGPRRHRRRRHHRRRHRARRPAPKPAPKPTPPGPTPTVPDPTPTTPVPPTTTPVLPVVPGTTPTDVGLHYLNRLGCGFSPATADDLAAAGGADAWLERQLSPGSVPESATANALPSWFPDMDSSAQAKWATNVNGTKGGWEYAADFAGYSMLRQVYSTRQVFENLVSFWSHHLHVYANHDSAWIYRKSYDDTVRQHALGTFEDLLVACSLHPAMLLYLDNWTSVRNAPNENQGRELLELHTVGRTAGYTEQMVKDSAKILSGYTVDAWNTWTPSYDSRRHTTGPVQVLGFSDANANADGSALTVSYLRYLAHHPATASRIATKLCRHFVADEPSDELVATVAKAFTDSGTDIRTTLRALVSHPHFLAGRGLLVRNPVEDFVATCRVLGVQAKAPTSEDAFARSCIWLPETTLLYQWPRPDGLPLGDAAWSSATRMLNSFRMHWNLAAGWWPTQDVSYRNAGAAWLPSAKPRLDEYADHLSRVVLGKPADDRTVAAICGVTGYPASTTIQAGHEVVGWMHVRVMGVLLDSPDHMRR